MLSRLKAALSRQTESWHTEIVVVFAVLGVLAGIAILRVAYASPASETKTIPTAVVATPLPSPEARVELPVVASQRQVATDPQAALAVAADTVPEPEPTGVSPEPSDTVPVEVLEPTEEPAPDVMQAAVETISYTVVAGDTLLGIAMKYDVPMAAIQLKNDLGDAMTIRLGQVLQIPPTEAWSHGSRFWVLYQVAAGDTLGAIAARYGLDLAEVEVANQGLDTNRITVGQPLILPLQGPVTAQVRDSVAPKQASPATAVPTPTAAPVIAAQVEPEVGQVEVEEPPTEVAEIEAPVATPLPEVAAPSPDIADLASNTFRLVNAERAAYGLPPLAWNATLARAAQRHADDCYRRGWCSHTGSDGSTYRQRIVREGYNPIRWSECWAWYGTAERAVAMWMNETPPNDPHRRTILNSALTELGVAVVPGNGFGYYFIANFGTPAP
jgi:uncharacterized protein YkwD